MRGSAAMVSRSWMRDCSLSPVKLDTKGQQNLNPGGENADSVLGSGYAGLACRQVCELLRKVYERAAGGQHLFPSVFQVKTSLYPAIISTTANNLFTATGGNLLLPR